MSGDNITTIIVACIGAWVALAQMRLSSRQKATHEVVETIAPLVADMAPKVTAIDVSVNGIPEGGATLRSTAEATGTAVDRVEAEQLRVKDEKRDEQL